MAMIMCMIMVVASMCMITSATVFSAEEKADTVTDEISESKAETEESSTTVETTVVTLETAEETTTTKAETTTLEDVGAAIRKGLKVKVRDIVYFGDTIKLYDLDGNTIYVNPGDYMYIVGVDDANQRFRVITSRGKYSGTPHLKYEDAKEYELMMFCISNEGFVVGDLNLDGHVNACDLTQMKRMLIYSLHDDPLQNDLADFNDDGKVSLADVIKLQKWLLRIEK